MAVQCSDSCRQTDRPAGREGAAFVASPLVGRSVDGANTDRRTDRLMGVHTTPTQAGLSYPGPPHWLFLHLSICMYVHVYVCGCICVYA